MTWETVHTQTIDIVMITMLIAITSGSMKHWGNEIANVQPIAVVIFCTYLSNDRSVRHPNRCEKSHFSDYFWVLADLQLLAHTNTFSIRS